MTNREELRRLCDAATDSKNVDVSTKVIPQLSIYFDNKEIAILHGIQAKDVADFFAASYTAIPKLLDELDAKDARIKELEDELAYYKKQPEERVFLISPSLEKKIKKELEQNRAALEGDE